MYTPCRQITTTVGLEEMLKMCCWPVLLVCALPSVILAAAFYRVPFSSKRGILSGHVTL